MSPAALILAAGFSSRMGKFKPLLPLGNTTVLGQVVESLGRAGIKEICVVAGHRAPEVLDAAQSLGVTGVENKAFEQGMFSSIQAGCRALPPGISGFLLWPVDIPLIRSQTVTALMDAWESRKSNTRVIYPAYQGERGHPPVISADLIPDILNYSGPGGMRALLDQVEQKACDLAVWDRLILEDMDTPAAYERIRRAREGWDLPGPGEAEALMTQVLNLNPGLRAHGRAVAGVALELTRALNDKGHDLNLDLVHGAALLHDLAKGKTNHEARGAEVLNRLDLPRLGAVVAVHKDLVPTAGPVTEAEVVCLADKLVRGDRRVDLDERFRARLEEFKEDAAACAAVRRRWERARALADKIKHALA